MMEALVVRDIDAWLDVITRPAHRHVDANLLTFALGLRRHSKRGEKQNVTTGFLMDMTRPFELHQGFTKPAVREYSRAAATNSPSNNVPLERKEQLMYVVDTDVK